MNHETLTLLLDKNPGLLNILLTGVMLPIGILWLTNRYNRKMRESEMTIDMRTHSKEDLRAQKKMVYASLSKILFDIQELYSSLNAESQDDVGLAEAIKEFDESIASYHQVISDNMLYLSSSIINHIYTFYRQIGEMKLGLKEMSEHKAYDMVPISLYYSSQSLADTVIGVQEIFVKERSDLKIPFDRTQQLMMKNFCGSPPSDALKKKYELIKQSLALSHQL